jgi:hypothetical protein
VSLKLQNLNVYMSGTLVGTTANFVNAAGALTDPTTITLKYRASPGTIVTVVYPAAPIVRLAQGVYTANLDTTGWTGPGNQLWTTEWIGTGNVQAPGVDYFEVEPLAL